MLIKQIKSLRKKMPLQKLILYPIIGFILLVLLIKYCVMYAYTESIIEKSATSVSQKTSAAVFNHIDGYLRVSEYANEMNAVMAKDGILNINDNNQLTKFFLTQIKNDSRLNAVYFANEKGDAIAVRALENHKLATAFTSGVDDVLVYSLDNEGNRLKYLTTEKNYDAKTRPWYEGAKTSKSNYWTGIYSTLTEPPVLEITTSVPLLNEAGEVIGVFGADVFLTNLAKYMRDFTVSPNGIAYLIDSDGLLVTSSTLDNLFYYDNDGVFRVYAEHSSNKIIAESAKIAGKYIKSQPEVEQFEAIKQKIAGEDYYLSIWKYSYGGNFDWYLIIAIPESDFANDVNYLFFILTISTVLIIIIAVLLCNNIVNWIIEPIRVLNENVKAIRNDNWVKVDVDRTDILGELALSFNEMSQKLSVYYQTLLNKNKEMVELNAQLEETVKERTEKLQLLTITDDLTGLHNYRYLMNFLAMKISEIKRRPKPLSVVIFDLDFFKQINDTYGHLEGNKVLIKVAECLKSSLRNCDVTGRYGGEEFLLILPDADLEQAYTAAQRVRVMAENLVIGKKEIKITVSGGVSTYRRGDSIESLLQRADQNLYEAKTAGRNKIVQGF